jgi:gamma-glutamyl-gamma-aminobutyrate hydrolase PuuD
VTRRPVIGITRDADEVDEYAHAVEEGGGQPELLDVDFLDRNAGVPIAAILATLDGFVFSGGADVAPARFGAAVHPETEPATPARDDFELRLMRATFDAGMPVLAICRGIQVANVAFGGTLHQHVPDWFGTSVRHEATLAGRRHRGLIDEHVVHIEPGSRLAALAGTTLVTGSRHHQALDRIADGFRVVARTSDGVVEAMEPVRYDGFWLGVQWHPESTLALDAGQSRALFGSLVDAARGA